MIKKRTVRLDLAGSHDTSVLKQAALVNGVSARIANGVVLNSIPAKRLALQGARCDCYALPVADPGKSARRNAQTTSKPCRGLHADEANVRLGSSNCAVYCPKLVAHDSQIAMAAILSGRVRPDDSAGWRKFPLCSSPGKLSIALRHIRP
jgi:hypothetical protein